MAKAMTKEPAKAKARKGTLTENILTVGKAETLPAAAKSEKNYYQTMALTSAQQKRLKKFSAEHERPHKEILVTALMDYLDRNGG